MENEIKQELIRILGSEAYNKGDMIVPKNVSKLVKSVSYLVTQMIIISNMMKNTELTNHIISVIDSVEKILVDEKKDTENFGNIK